MLSGVEDAAAYIDNIIVVGQSNEELSEHIDQVLICIQDFSFQLQPEMSFLFTENEIFRLYF